MASPQWHFADFRLDPANACLWHGTQAIALTPKAFDVLHYLVTHPDRLVPKDTLLDAVWPATAVSDAVVRVAIGELRRALGDAVQAPRFIATVPRRGYRFLAPVTHAGPPDAVTSTPPAGALAPTLPRALSDAVRPLVGREAVLARLHAVWAQARQGQRQVLFLTGEPGIGKTVVVEAFTAQARQDPAVWVATGQCIEHYGPGEPYLPILEALGQLCRSPGGERLGTLLRQQAPTWLVQMPWLLTPTDREHLQYELQGATRGRMLREWAEVVDTLTAEIPLCLVLEDLHWSDYATLDLVAFLAQRRTPARLLVLGTYRPIEVIVQEHPLRTVVQGLQRQGHCTEIPLQLLSAVAISTYLTAHFPGHQFPEGLVGWLHQHTDGNPLFLVTLVADLITRGILAERAGRWSLGEGLEAAAMEVPESLRSLLDHHLARLVPATQRVLEVASTAGVEFAAAAVAAGLDTTVGEVEECCEGLVRQQILRPVGMTVWPDSTMTMQYTFTHALYQQVAYQRLGAGQRRRLHQRLGERLETAYGAQAGERAAELAEHFVQAQDTQRAVQYLRQTAENAAQRYAPQDVIGPLQRALALLATLRDTPARVQQEIDIQSALGAALIAMKGFAAPEVEHTYARARALCAQLGETPQLVPTLWSLSRFYMTRGMLRTARDLGEQLFRLIQCEAESTPRLEAYDALGGILFYLGEYAAARRHLEQGIALIDPTAQRTVVLRQGEASGVTCLAVAANTFWCLGYPAQALHRSHEVLAFAQALAHPYNLALALWYTTYLHHRRREVSAVQAQADTLLTLASAQGFPLYAGFGACARGWAMVMQGQDEAGLTQLRQGMATVLATGQSLSQPFCLVLLAEAVGHIGQVEEGLGLLTEAHAAFAASGRGDMLAEAYRLQGTLLLRQSVPDVSQAEACFQQALTIARRQQARSWELRAALSLSRLWQHQGKRAEAYDLLAPVYDWFTEGFDTADLQDAKAFLGC